MSLHSEVHLPHVETFPFDVLSLVCCPAMADLASTEIQCLQLSVGPRDGVGFGCAALAPQLVSAGLESTRSLGTLPEPQDQ